MVMPVIISFGFISWSVWGPYFIYFRSFSLVVVNILLFTVGVGPSNTQLEINMFWTLIFYIFYMIFSIFIVICVYTGIYMEAFREVTIKLGYLDDIKAWSFLDYLVWFLQCFNQKKLRDRIETYLKKRKEKQEQMLKMEEEGIEPKGSPS